MTQEERNNMISVIEWKSNWNYEDLKQVNDITLERLYRIHVEGKK